MPGGKKDPRFDPTPETANEALQNAAILHAHFLERLKASEVRTVLSFLDRVIYRNLEDRIMFRLAKVKTRGYRSGVFRQKQLERMFAETKAIIEDGYRELLRIEQASLVGAAVAESEWAIASAARATAPLAVALNSVDLALIRSMVKSSPFEGQFLGKWYGGLAANLQESVKAAISTGLAVGDSVPTMRRALQSVVGTSSRHAETVVRTSMTHVTSQAREMTYKENDDLVEAVKWVSTLDHRTTPICQSLDGRVFPVDEGQRPPAHHRCRSTTVPVLKSWKDIGIDFPEAEPSTRATRFMPSEKLKVEKAIQKEMARGRGRGRSQAIKNIKTKFGGQVPADMTYPQWLKRQPASIQDEVLGPTRGKLLRSGKIKVDRFIKDGRMLTLKELRIREGLDKL